MYTFENEIDESVTKSPRAVIAIPCLNEANYIGGLLARLLEDTESLGTPIVVADGGSRDGTLDIVARMARENARVSLVNNPLKLQSAAVNQVAHLFAGRADYLVRIDAHATYPENFVESLLSTARATGAQSVVVPMVSMGLTCFQIAAATAQNSLLGTGGSSHRHAGKSGWIDHGHHALFDLNYYMRLGGYDESFSHNEDAEYDYRLAQIGGRAWLAGDQAITYYPRKTPTTLFRQYFNFGRGRARTVRLHKMRLKVRQGIPILIAPVCFMALLAPLSPIFALPSLVWVVGCLGYGLKLGMKHKSLCASFSGVAAMLMHFGWSAGFWSMVFASSDRVGHIGAAPEQTSINAG